MNCTKCGTELTEGAKFCPDCGHPVQPVQPEQPSRCRSCGTELPEGVAFCPNCGTRTDAPGFAPQPNRPQYPVSRRERIIAIVLCCIGFCGLSGLHRFYTGKIGTGIVWLFTGGCFLVGTIVDLVNLIDGRFFDDQGLPLV